MKCTWMSTSPGKFSPSQNSRTSSTCGSGSVIPSLASTTERLLHLAVRVAARQVLPLVVGLLAAGQADLDLHLAVAEVHRQRDERQPALLRLADQPLDLT